MKFVVLSNYFLKKKLLNYFHLKFEIKLYIFDLKLFVMEAIQLKLQRNFSTDEFTIVDLNLVNTSKNKLEKAYVDLKSGTAQFCSIEELDLLLDKTFSKYDS